MDPLERDDIERSRATSPAVKLRQALELMDAGMRMQRAKLRREHPDASNEELERMFRAWLQRDD